MASIQRKNLYDRIKNDTSKSVQFTLTDESSVAIDLTGASIQIQFRYKSKTGTIVKDISVGSGITVATPASGILVIDAFTCDWTPDIYYYDVQITFADTTIQTPVWGTVTVLQDVTDS